MFRVIFLSLGLAVVVSGQPDKMHGCGRLMHGGMACCNKKIKAYSPLTDDMKECFQLAKKPPSCEMEICIARKMGVASADGTVDKNAFAEQIVKNLENDPDLADRIKANCLNGDLSKYGKEDFCDLMKIQLCTQIQIVKNCNNEWSDEGNCKRIKDIAAECTKQFD